MSTDQRTVLEQLLRRMTTLTRGQVWPSTSDVTCLYGALRYLVANTPARPPEQRMADVTTFADLQASQNRFIAVDKPEPWPTSHPDNTPAAAGNRVLSMLQHAFYTQFLADRGVTEAEDSVESLQRALHNEYKCGVTDALAWICANATEVTISNDGSGVTKIVILKESD